MKNGINNLRNSFKGSPSQSNSSIDKPRGNEVSWPYILPLFTISSESVKCEVAKYFAELQCLPQGKKFTCCSNTFQWV